MIIRKMTEEDIPAVVLVDESAFSKCWNGNMFCEELRKDYSDYFVAENDTGIIGYAGIWSIYETAELMRIAVMPGHRNKGIARSLLEKITDCANENGCHRMMLEVRESNVPARKLYESAGFKEISVRKGYYDGEDAVIMEATFSL